MPRSKKDESPHSYQLRLLSKVIDYKSALRAHLNCSDSDSDSSGASDFTEEYYKLRPPPIKISDSSGPNLLYSKIQPAEESNTITIERKSGAAATNYQTDVATITQSIFKTNLNKKKRRKAKKTAKLTLEAISELNSVLIECEQNANSESEINARPGLSSEIASPENLNSLARLESSVNEMNREHHFATPFIEVKPRKPKKRTNKAPLRYIRACVSSPSILVSKTKQQALLEERIKSQIRTSPLWSYFENFEMTLREMELLRHHFIEQYLQEEQQNGAVKMGKKALRKARARLSRNLTLDFSSFFNANLQGEQSVERLLETGAGFNETEQLPQQDCVVKVGKTSKKATTRKQHDALPQVDFKPQVGQPNNLEWYNFVTEGFQELQSVDRPMKTRLIPGSNKMQPQVEQQDCVSREKTIEESYDSFKEKLVFGFL